MGSLVPGASYLYDTIDGVVYATIAGSNIKTEIGRYSSTLNDEDLLWADIRAEARNNLALHNALENAKIIYYLSKNNGS